VKPFAHQVVGIEALVKWDDIPVGRIWPGCFALFDEMGLGKTKQCIDAAQLLYESGDIDSVIVAAPAAVRSVWYDPEFGELKRHLKPETAASVLEFHAKKRTWSTDHKVAKRLKWTITNYDFLRAKPRLEDLIKACDARTLLIVDESSAVKNARAAQTAAIVALRQKARRVWLLNGTPIANSPLDMYAQGLVMDPRILGCQSYYHFRSRYAIMGGWNQKQITGWRDLDDLQRRFKPYVLRRLKKDCLDLPEKIPAVTLTVTLSPHDWTNYYKPMRDEMVAWLDDQTMSIAVQAGVKAMRLSQICSGFLGGVEALPAGLGIDSSDDDRPDWIPGASVQPGDRTERQPIQEINRAKLDMILEWLENRIEDDGTFKAIIWCRFRAELHRLMTELAAAPWAAKRNVKFGEIHGGQKKHEREIALRLLDPRTAPLGPVIVGGTPATGSMGLNLTAANTVVYMSNDYNLKTRLQSEDRVHRPGQVRPVSYFDVVAVGPSGQKTMDHAAVKALRNKENMANWTCEAWRAAIMEE